MSNGIYVGEKGYCGTGLKFTGHNGKWTNGNAIYLDESDQFYLPNTTLALITATKHSMTRQKYALKFIEIKKIKANQNGILPRCFYCGICAFQTDSIRFDDCSICYWH